MKTFKMVFALLAISLLLVACGPPKLEQIVEIDTNETAFLVPLEGESKTDQAQFFSEEYLNANKVASKRISLPLRKLDTGRFWYEYDWIPTVRVVKVNRAPVTREWTPDTNTGTKKQNDAINVESKDSIGFWIGINLTGMITEKDTARFLYYFAGKPLAQVIDENVRSTITSILSREFAKVDLEAARGQKNEIIERVAKEVKREYAEMGVTITTIGISEGLAYEDQEIQQVLNDKFTAEMGQQIQGQKNLAQEKVNDRNIGIAIAERKAADEFAKAAQARTELVKLEIAQKMAEAKLIWAQKWNGALPVSLLPDNSNMLMSLETK